MGALRRMRSVARKEAKILLRDRFLLFIAIGLPVLTMILMGYGINFDVKNLPLGVADLDRTAGSRAFADAFVRSTYFRLAVDAVRPDDLDGAMEAGHIRVGVIIPQGFSRTLSRGMPADVQILIDGSLPTRAEIARSYALAIVARFNESRLRSAAMRFPAAPDASSDLNIINRVWFNPGLESKNFLVPGLLVISLLFWAPLLVSLSVTREKETGAILNVQTVPLARWEYILGKLIPYSSISFASYGLLVLAGVVVFQVPFKGSLLALTAGGLLYVIAITALGLLVSTLVRTQVTALLSTVVVAITVGLFYSGWMEPVQSLATRGQILGRLLPTADFMTMARGVFLKGLGFDAYARTLAVLGVYALAYTLLAVAGFRKRRR